MHYAGFWRRLAAALLDMAILSPLFLLTWSLRDHRTFHFYWLVPGAVIALGYHVYLVARFGGTPGKLLLGMRIRMVDGRDVTGAAAAIRFSPDFLLGQLSSVSIGIAILAISDQEWTSAGGWLARGGLINAHTPPWHAAVGYAGTVWFWSEFLTLLFNRKRRALHDFLAGTVVLVTRPDAVRVAPRSATAELAP